MFEPYISIIMATYNSGKTIEKSLKSIRCQNLEESLVEVLVIDGGSTDNTIDIAKKYNCKVLENPYRLPEFAKRIGLRNAKGKYMQIMDSDEVFPENDVLSKRIEFMESHVEVKLLLAGCTSPKDFKSLCGEYINVMGDPFSAFTYNWFDDGNIGLVKRASTGCNDGAYISRFGKNEITPIGDSLTLFRGDYVRKHHNDELDEVNSTVLFQRVLRETHLVAHIEGDYVYHYSKSGFKDYLRKLKFRVINNVFDKNGSGYSSTSVGNKKLSYRKYLYPLYCVSLVLPLYHGVAGCIRYKDSGYLLHPIFCWYVLLEILYQYSKKIFGKKSVNRTYG